MTKLLISGVCGFVGTALAQALLESDAGLSLWGIDNFIRPGSQTNIDLLKKAGVRVRHGDVRAASDFEGLPEVDWVIDCAANPSVLAGVDGQTSSRQILEHNLIGTINLLEYAKRCRAGFVLLSTSRVYGIAPLATLPLVVRDRAYAPETAKPLPPGLTADGIAEGFSTAAPISLYGATKLASETLALEYGAAFGLPVFVNRCGVLAGAGQFGRPDQGIFSYWIHSWARRRPLKYIGFGGEGYQVRDCLHPADLAPLVLAQMKSDSGQRTRVVNVGGGSASCRSLRQLSDWSTQRFGAHTVGTDPAPRAFDLPWVVLNAGEAEKLWGWKPRRGAEQILEEIARHAELNPQWLDVSAPL